MRLRQNPNKQRARHKRGENQIHRTAYGKFESTSLQRRVREQLVGHPFGEAALYRVAQFYEDETGWTKRHPPGLSE